MWFKCKFVIALVKIRSPFGEGCCAFSCVYQKTSAHLFRSKKDGCLINSLLYLRVSKAFLLRRRQCATKKTIHAMHEHSLVTNELSFVQVSRNTYISFGFIYVHTNTLHFSCM